MKRNDTEWNGRKWKEIEQNRMKQNKTEWSRTKQNEAEWNRMKQNEWNGTKIWDDIKWNTINCHFLKISIFRWMGLFQPCESYFILYHHHQAVLFKQFLAVKANCLLRWADSIWKGMISKTSRLRFHHRIQQSLCQNRHVDFSTIIMVYIVLGNSVVNKWEVSFLE